MRLLKERIQRDGQVLSNEVLKVDRFLTHQIDPELMKAIALEFVREFADSGITKVVTIESSGIAPALFTAYTLGVPMIFARKVKSLTLSDELLTTEVYSYTKKGTRTVSISKKGLSSEDNVLILDDFLANGEAALGLIDLCHQAGAEIKGIGILIEKSFQPGREKIEAAGYNVHSLARIASLKHQQVTFIDE